jgi:Cu(I)/Ag(I) efflux system protein CusF
MKESMKMKTQLRMLLATCTMALAAPMAALAGGDHGAAPAATDMTDGEVRKVDKEAGKVTLKHANIKNLDMPAMTMVFVVNDKSVLDKLQPGDKVKFKAINDAGKFTVTEIAPAH